MHRRRLRRVVPVGQVSGVDHQIRLLGHNGLDHSWKLRTDAGHRVRGLVASIAHDHEGPHRIGFRCGAGRRPTPDEKNAKEAADSHPYSLGLPRQGRARIGIGRGHTVGWESRWCPIEVLAKPIWVADRTNSTTSSMMAVGERSVGLQKDVRWKPIRMAAVWVFHHTPAGPRRHELLGITSRCGTPTAVQGGGPAYSRKRQPRRPEPRAPFGGRDSESMRSLDIGQAGF